MLHCTSWDDLLFIQCHIFQRDSILLTWWMTFSNHFCLSLICSCLQQTSQKFRVQEQGNCVFPGSVIAYFHYISGLKHSLKVRRHALVQWANYSSKVASCPDATWVISSGHVTHIFILKLKYFFKRSRKAYIVLWN